MLNGWSNKSFDMLLELLLDAFPDGAKIPKSHYVAKKMLQDFGLGYDSINACKYDCALFCDAPKPGGPLTTRQPAEYKWMLGYPKPLQKIGQSLLCTGSSTHL